MVRLTRRYSHTSSAVNILGVAKEKVMFGRSAEAAKRFCFVTLGAIRIALGLHHKTLVRDFALKVYRVLGWLLMCPLPQQDCRKRSQ